MGHWLTTFINLCKLKTGPQDLPLSRELMYVSVFAYWLMGVVLTLVNQTFGQAVFLSLVQTIILVFICKIVLWIAKKPERSLQTLTALAGSGALIALLAWPLLMWMGQAEITGEHPLAILWLLLVIWETVVIGHIFRHALEIPFLAGIGVALVFVYMTFTVTVRFLRVMSMTTGSGG